MKKISNKILLSPAQILAVGFAIIILAGGVLLSLPVSNRTGEPAPFLQSIFTSASATCVTGLVVCDTYSQFTMFGQIIIAMLIQIGGLGFITLAMSFVLLSGSKISIFQRRLIMESMGSTHVGGVVKMLRRILIGSIIIESIGAISIASRVIPKLGFGQGLWYGVFHSVSAFCNAGFDLMGYFKAGSSITLFADDPVMEITIMLLIIIGGIGFVVWNDIVDNRFHFRNYSLHSKVMISFTLILIVTVAALFFFIERSHAFSSMNDGEALMNSFFASITPRTAGFNSIDYNDMTPAGRLLTMISMFIGAGPGSTGGGIKVTTFAAIIFSLHASAKNYSSVSVFKRQMPDDTQKRVLSVVLSYIMLTAVCLFIILVSNPSITFEQGLFESLSAIGTVGLSMGITANLNILAKIMLILLMYCGRIGSISVAVALMRKINVTKISYPKEKITLG